jgi:hypothetical protein
MSDGIGKRGKTGRISAAHSALQMRYLNYLNNAMITGPRADFVYAGHGVFRGLVNEDTVASLRAEATAIKDDQWSGIFNKGTTTKSRRTMCKATELGPKVNSAIFEFLQTRALLATKWHNLALSRHSSFLRSEPGTPRQTAHTDFDPSRMADAVERQPEFHSAKSFSVMTILQPTKLYFVDHNGEYVAAVMTAGDVVVFAGDVDHCGAEWSTVDGCDATTAFGNPNNYRLFCYVPSFYKVEFLVPWIVCDRNREHLVEVDAKVAVNLNLFEKTDPEKQVFCQKTFSKYLRYGSQIFHYTDLAYFNGIDTFPMRKLGDRRLPQKVEQVAMDQPCPHFAGVRADFFAMEDRLFHHQLKQLKLNCFYCSQSTTHRAHKRRRQDASFNIDIDRIENTASPVWKLMGQTKLVKAAAKFVLEYRKAYP